MASAEQGKWDNYVIFTEVNLGRVAVNARKVSFVRESKEHRCAIYFGSEDNCVVVECTLDAILSNLQRASR
jgi:hypothetical protein